MSPAKSSEDARKQSSTADDGSSSSRTTAPKAWTTGTNPITQRPSGSTPVNGMANGHAQEHGKSSTKSNQSADKHAHDRLLFLYANFVGLDTVLTLKSGEQFEGVFSGATTQNNEARYHLKMVRRLNAPSQQANGSSASVGSFIGEGEDHSMAFDVNDTVDLAVQRVPIGGSTSRATNGAGFRTDVEISGNLDVREKVLQRWEPGPEDGSLSLNQDESLGSGSWDQFAANEKLYNVRSDYDEDMYTTSIDKTNPRYRQIADRAERLAREMEKDGESRKVVDSGLDEEDKYSGVRRDTPSLGSSGPNAYVPPSKRAITNKPTVSGAPFDPAIISSQLARPNSGSDAKKVTEKPSEKQANTEATAPAVSQSVKDSVARSLAANPTNGPAAKIAAPRAPSAAEASASAASKAAAENGENIMRDVHDAFKQFTSAEKLRIQQQQRQHQQQRASHARQEKSVKLNDLKKFSQNFKLHSRVPEDLVPILAKSKEKQESIKAKADQHAREREERRAQGVVTPPSASKAESSQQAQRPAQTTETLPDPAPQMSTRTRSQQQGRAQNGPTQQGPRVPGGFNQRTQMPYRQTPNGGIPAPIPIPQVTPGQTDNRVLSPTSATSIKFNANAMEFRPNPSASTFTPTAPATEAPASKRPSVVSPPPAAPVATPPVTEFFPSSARKSKLADGKWESTTATCFSTVKRLYEQNSDDSKRAQYAANGGIPQGYRTSPVWDYPEANSEKSYVDFYARSINHPPPSPMHAVQNGAMPHQHQLPLHLQNGGSGMQQTPPFYRGQAQQNGQQPMDDGRMPSYSSTSSVQPSPRMAQPPMAYNAQAQAHMGYPYPMGANGMSPGMGMRPVPAGAQYMTPQGAPMGGHMMVQQPSNGPYMGHPGQGQVHMYPSPGPSHVQPHFGGHPGQPGMPGGYSGSPRAHPMSHQGSQQGHTPQQMFMMPGQGAPMMMMPQHGGHMGPMRYGQPQFQGQHPGNAYAMQQRAMSSGGYTQHMTPRQQHAVPHQGQMAPQMHPSASTNGEEGR
ncbi:hypothetical protein BDZ85DRAFT_112264 [Elsinoe ampelina]|uniref:LsmAD domain-containing protein n=1 Tax=Elsinoe ampelina TaxID=302913 RepID=A0A6A6GDE5_9PEZI|nr:hypothetical protein BDZ85DRAFT_112264 [Elsinoe ampelina]